MAAAALLALAGRRPAAVRMLGLVAIASIVGYIFTPETAAGPEGEPTAFVLNVRYAAPGVALALALVPAPIGGLRRGAAVRLTLGGALLAALVAETATTQLLPSYHRNLAAAAGVGAALLAAALLVPPRARRVLAPAALAAGLLVAVAVGLPRARTYLRSAYTVARVPYTSWIGFGLQPVFAWVRTVHHSRIAIAGTGPSFFQYPLYGADFTNSVRTVAQPGPHGSFTPLRTCTAWRAALARGHYRYLVVGPTLDIWHPFRAGPSHQVSWTRGDPAAVEILHLRSLVTVFRIDRRMDPSGCPPA
jgi:hypothetical protein